MTCSVPEMRSRSESGETRRPRQIDPHARTDVDARAHGEITSIDPSSASRPSGASIVSAGTSRRVPSKASRPATVPDSVGGAGGWEADAERAGPEGAGRGRGRRRVDREIDRAHHERAPAHLVVDAHGQLSDIHTAQAQRRHFAGRGSSSTRKVERAVRVADDGDPRPHELEACDLDMAEEQAASQRQPKAVGVQQGAPALVVHRP